MCGIAGVISDQNSRPKLKEILSELHHRGPDGQDENKDDLVALGMTRLAIIDIKGGMQPLYNEDHSIEIVGNGEIYNYKELQALLKNKGHKLRTRSDIETAAHLYEQYGLRFVHKLRGMFALAIYDKKKRKVILVRDRMGEKPLYYYRDNKTIIFSSELKSLGKVGIADKILDPDTINAFLHYNYVPEPNTLFKKIHKLPAGSIGVIDVGTKRLNISRYYFPESIQPKKKGSPVTSILSNLQEACELALRADVEVGVSLSGGIDSGSILALSAASSKSKLKAFTVGYEGSPQSDERNQAKELADRLGIRYFEHEIRTVDFVNDFPKIVHYSDDPIADIAGYSIFSVCGLAGRHGIKVLLGGLGGDELFWGYPWVKNVLSKNLNSRARNFLFYEDTVSFRNFRMFTSHLLTSSFRKSVNGLKTYKNIQSKLGNARLAMSLIRDVWLKSNCIALNDRLSMASSVELRSPFLDYQLVQTAYGYLENVLSFDKGLKVMLKRSLAGVLPDEVLNMPKRGFTPPVFSWLKGVNSGYIHLLESGFLVQEGILSPVKIQLLTRIWRLLPMFWYTVYQLLVLEIWCRLNVWNEQYENIHPAAI